MRDNKGNILAVIGAQYGSEGKGVVVAHLANQFDIHVRVGGPNAGHSIYFNNRIYKMQCLPCGWINPDAVLVIGAGALVDLRHLEEEMAEVERVMPGIYDRTFIDAGAAVLDIRHHQEEGGVEGQLHARIGSTGHGVGAARHARMSRDPDRISLVRDAVWDYPRLRQCVHTGTADYITDSVRYGGRACLLEGTQGSGLSLVHGPWPYVTSADTNAAQMAADIGIPPRFITKTILVARTYPIRVAGNSGPMYKETSWEELSARMGKAVKEQTTVTKKTRRVGEWDEELFVKSCRLNAPTSIALMFMDYLCPEDEGKEDFGALSREARKMVHHVEKLARTPVALIGTGGTPWRVIDRGGAL